MRHLLAIAAACLLMVATALSPATAHAETWSDFDLVRIDGKPLTADTLAGRVVLVVNVASFCSFTAQYSDLQALYERYEAQGLVVLGVPCNQFGSQEPGSNAEIKNFCKSRYGVDFPLLEKQDVNGTTRSTLYRWLNKAYFGADDRDVSWNFEKFIVDRTGKVVGHFGSHVSPKDPRLLTAIEFALSASS